MSIPVIGAATSLLGGLVGGAGQYNDTQRGMTAYRNLANRGVSTLEGGKSASNQAFSPYTNAGQVGVAGQTAATQNYLQNVGASPDAGQFKTTAQGTQAYLDPSAAYSTDQANRALQASALAKGGVGGGLARALSNNANKMAMTNWNNAFQQQLGTNQQNYNQAANQWSQSKSAQDSNVANYAGLTNTGLQATSGNQANQLAYNQGINQNYVNQADAMQSGWNAKGQIFNNTANAFGKGLSGLVGGIFGSAGGKP